MQILEKTSYFDLSTIHNLVCRQFFVVLACILVAALLPSCAQPPQYTSSNASEPNATEKKENTSGKKVAIPLVVPPRRPPPKRVILASRSTYLTTNPAPILKLPPNIQNQPIRIGLLLPLTGQNSDSGLGHAMLNAATLALFDIGHKKLVLMPRDTGGTPEGAKTAAAELAEEGVEIILGPLFNTSVQAAATVTRARNLPMIAFSSDRRVAGNGIYLLSFTPYQEVEAIISFAVSKGLQRFALLAPNDPYGLTVLDATRRVISKYGAELIQVELYSPDGKDLDKTVKRLAHYHYRRKAMLARRKAAKNSEQTFERIKLKTPNKFDALAALNYDAVLLPEGGELLKALAPLLPYYDIDTRKIRILGTGRWDDPAVRLEPALLGGWFAGADRTTAAIFRDRYKNTFGYIPTRLASLSYDAMALAAVLAAEAEGPNFTKLAITNPNGYVGSDGIFRFNSSGLAERGMAILEVGRETFGIRRKPPVTFETPEN